MKKIIAGALLTLMIAGCATTSGTQAITSVSSFDGTKSVSIEPHTLGCVQTVVCTSLGFAWTDKEPSMASILIEVTHTNGTKHHPISSAKLNIDGDIVDIKPFPGSVNRFESSVVSTIPHTETNRLFVAPLDLLYRVKNSTNTKMQVVAEGALTEKELKNSGDSSFAYHSMIRFLDQVEASK